MKTRAPSTLRSAAVSRGRVAPGRAASTGLVTITDLVTEVSPAEEIEVAGGLVEDLGEGRARITLGGGGAGGGAGSGGAPVQMLNNSGADLVKGSVVVVDETEDRAVTTTTTAGDTRIAGVVQAPIAAGDTGPVLFNGYTAEIVTTGTVTRGDYAQASAIAVAAQATAAREAGSFAVFTSVPDIAEFATDSAVTADAAAVTSLAITMPDSVGDGTAIGSLLFLALIRDPAVVTAVTLTGWTRIGATSGFWYYYRICAGGDTATASWSSASPATGIVLALDERVSIADPVEDQDFDATTAAAGIAGLSSAPRYAIAAVQDALAGAESDWTLLAEGEVGTGASPVGIVQQTALTSDETNGVSFASPVTVGHMLVWVCWVRAVGNGTSQPDCRKLGSGSSPDTTYTYTQVKATPADADGMAIGYKIADSTSQGPFKAMSAVNSTTSRWMLYEIEAAGTPAFLSLDDQAGATTIDLGDFTTSVDDLVFMGVVWKSGTDPAVTVGDWAQEVDSQNPFGHPWAWLGKRDGNGGTLAAEITASNTGRWGGVALHLPPGTTHAAGSLLGQYIGRAATVDSPFTGAVDQLDAVFALNLTTEPLASALLYGPDLGTAPASGGGGSSGAGLFWDGDSWEPAYAPEPLILEDGTIAVLENGSAAMSEPVFI